MGLDLRQNVPPSESPVSLLRGEDALPVTKGQSWTVVDDGDLAKPTSKTKGSSTTFTWQMKKKTAAVTLSAKDADEKVVREFSFTLVVGASPSKITCPPQRTIKCGLSSSGSVPPPECAADKREAFEKECGINFVF